MSDALARAAEAADLLAVLRRPSTIRARCAAVADAVADDRSGWFRLDRSRLPEAAARVAALTRRRFPDLRIPYHSRWRHFEAGGLDRKAELDAALAGRSAAERARAQFDLTLLSVLLDAGAGPSWAYVERPPGGAEGRYTRSEGLGVASFRGFMAGAFSSHRDEPWRVDAQALRQVDAGSLRALFQSSPSNPLLGLEGRAGLLVRLGWCRLPKGMNWSCLGLIGVLAGIGFTMSIFIATLAFADPSLLGAAKLGVLLASALAACLGLTLGGLLVRRARSAAPDDAPTSPDCQALRLPS